MIMDSRKVLLSILLCALISILPSVYVQAESSSVTLDFKDIDIRDILRTVSKHSGINFVVDPEVSGEVTAHLNESSVIEGLHQLLIAHGWFLDINNDIYRVRQGVRNDKVKIDVYRGLLQIEARGVSLEELVLSSATLLGVDVLPLVEMSTQIYANISGLSFEQLLEHVLNGQKLEWYYNDGIYFIRDKQSLNSSSEQFSEKEFRVQFRHEKLWVEAQDVPLSMVLQEIAKQAEIDLMVAPDVTDLARIFLFGVDLDVAVAQIMTIHQLSMEQVGGVLQVYAVDRGGSGAAQNLVTVREGLVSLQAKNAPLSKILEEIAIQSNTTIAFNGEKESFISLHLRDYPLYDTLQILAQTSGLDFDEKQGSYIFVPGLSIAMNDEHFQIKTNDNGSVDIILKEAPLRLVVGNLATVMRKNIIVSPEVNGTISLLLHDVSLEEAFESILEISGLSLLKVRDGLEKIISEQDRTNEHSLPPGVKTIHFANGMMSLEVHNIQLGELIGVFADRYSLTSNFPSIAVAGNLSSIEITGAISRMPVLEGLRNLLIPYKLSVAESAKGLFITEIKDPEPYQISLDNGKFNIIARDAPINEILEEIGRQIGVSFVLPPDLTFQVNFDVNQIDPSQAVQLLLEPYGYTIDSPSKLTDELKGVLRILPPSTSLVRYGDREKTFTLLADDADLSTILKELARISGRNIIFRPGTFPRVSIELRNLSVEEILSLLAETYELDITVNDSYYSIENKAEEKNRPTSSQRQVPIQGISFFEYSEEYINIIFSNVSVQELLDLITGNGGPKFVVDVSIGNRKISGEIEGVQPLNNVNTFLQNEGFHLIEVPEQIFVKDSSLNKPLIYLSNDLFYLDIHGGDLPSIIREMANKVGYPVIIYPTVRGTVNSLQIKGVSFELGLYYLLQGTTFTFDEIDGVYVIGEGITPRVESPGFTESKIIYLKHLSPSEILSLLPPSIPNQNIRSVPGDRAIVAFGNAKLLKIIEEFIDEVDQPLQSSPVLWSIKYADSTEVTTVLAHNFSSDMFHYIKSQNSILLVSSKEKNDEMIKLIQGIDVPELAAISRLIPLFHIRAEEAKNYLGQTFDGLGVQVIPEQNSLMVTANKEQLSKIETYLGQIDIRNPQIIFEISIVEIGTRNNTQFGVNASTGDGTIKFDLDGQSPLTLTLGKGFLVDASSKMVLQTLIQDGQAKLLANPTLTTLNGKEASFNVLTTSRYWVPESERTGDNNATKTQNTQAFRTIETGIRLRLKPWISASGEITIEVDPEISDSAGASSASSLPSTNDRSVHTTIRVKDGETIVIGGLIQRSEQKEITKIPILGYIPVLGALFRSERTSEIETEFVITITSHVLDFSVPKAN